MNLLKKNFNYLRSEAKGWKNFFMTGDSIHISAEDLSSDGD